MDWIELLVGGLIGLATSYSLIPVILQACRRSGRVSRAGEAHHTHQIAVPRLGGIALAAALVVTAVLFSISEPGFLAQHDHWLMVASALAMFGLGLWDDLSALGARRKLLVQVLIASFTYFCGIGIAEFRIPFTDHLVHFGLWGWPVTVFWLVAMTNLINLIDGVDGLAGGICLMLMLLLVYVSWHTGFAAIISGSMAGALLGFLRFNFPPARIYLGDGGAYFLGCLIGCQTIVTSQKGTILAALVAPLFVLALPIIDTALAILRRGVRGLPVFRPDRKHLHHRLLAQGYSRRTVVLGLYGFTAFFLMLGFLAYYWHGQYFELILGIGTLAVILAAGRFNFSREWFAIGRVLGNSLEARADIQYAIGLSRFLAAEGLRAESLASIAGDVVFIARKLGFASVRMRLEDDEKFWPLAVVGAENSGRLEPAPACASGCCLRNFPEKRQSFRHPLAGHKYCFLELVIACPEPKTAAAAAACQISEPRLNTYSIQAELVAEGWNKAVKDWQKRRQLPPRFDALPATPDTTEALQPKPNLTGTQQVPLEK